MQTCKYCGLPIMDDEIYICPLCADDLVNGDGDLCDDSDGRYDLGTCETCLFPYLDEHMRRKRCGLSGFYCEEIKFCGLWKEKENHE